MAATKTTKAATTKAPAKKPAQKVTKKTPAKKPVTKAPVEEVEEDEPEKMSLKKKIALGAAAVVTAVGGIALAIRSAKSQAAAEQAVVDIDNFSNRPVEVNVNLVPGETNVGGLDMGDEPIVEAEVEVEDPIE